MKRAAPPKIGSLVTIEWEDASTRLGEPLPNIHAAVCIKHSTGWLVGINRHRLLLSSEHDGDDPPCHDWTLIPAPLVRAITVLSPPAGQAPASGELHEPQIVG